LSGSISETADTRIGARSYTPLTNYFPGQIDEVKIWNYELTDIQVRSEYNSGVVNYGY
jgi:hypothetical protein